jgi:exodeoxyribonuclease V alpha subunit
MLSRALLYTAVTRAERLCILVGERRAIAMALGRGEQRRRHSGLVERILDASQETSRRAPTGAAFGLRGTLLA